MAISAEDSKAFSGNVEFQSYKVFNDISADETKSDAIDARNAEAITLLVECSAGVNGGVVKLEAAQTSDYAGTWAELASITTSAASKALVAHFSSGPVKYVRARIETAIGVGTVDAYIMLQR